MREIVRQYCHYLWFSRDWKGRMNLIEICFISLKISFAGSDSLIVKCSFLIASLSYQLKLRWYAQIRVQPQYCFWHKYHFLMLIPLSLHYWISIEYLLELQYFIQALFLHLQSLLFCSARYCTCKADYWT